MDKFLEYILGLQEQIMPERLASWKQLSVLTLFAMVLILVSEGINKEILAVWSVIFIAIVIWFFLCDSFTANHRRATSEGPVAGCH
ncbi:MAG: hypothetical protein GDA48_12735 [Hormoscilla sp. GM102CHS1]|nr:hypothetical protein [Hormoscilla sp. GM102CHS1]